MISFQLWMVACCQGFLSFLLAGVRLRLAPHMFEADVAAFKGPVTLSRILLQCGLRYYVSYSCSATSQHNKPGRPITIRSRPERDDDRMQNLFASTNSSHWEVLQSSAPSGEGWDNVDNDQGEVLFCIEWTQSAKIYLYLAQTKHDPTFLQHNVTYLP